MTNSRVELGEIAVNFAPLRVPYAVLLPPGYENGGPYPLCLVLHGGGGSRQNLIDSKPLYDKWWNAGQIPPMVLASASTDPLSFYFDHPDGSHRWEEFIADDFLGHLRANYKIRSDRASTLITGASMGGYGSLKIAFGRPDRFAAVAALEPAVEPAIRAADLGARKRFSFPKTGTAQELVGDNRDPALFREQQSGHQGDRQCWGDPRERSCNLPRGRRRRRAQSTRRDRVSSSRALGPGHSA